jgi:hypothetical protein
LAFDMDIVRHTFGHEIATHLASRLIMLDH